MGREFGAHIQPDIRANGEEDVASRRASVGEFGGGASDQRQHPSSRPRKMARQTLCADETTCRGSCLSTNRQTANLGLQLEDFAPVVGVMDTHASFLRTT